MTDAAENVVWLEGAKVQADGVPVDQVLETAKGHLREVVVLGLEKETGHLYAAASFPGTHSAQETVWLMEFAKKWLLDGCPAQGGDE